MALGGRPREPGSHGLLGTGPSGATRGGPPSARGWGRAARGEAVTISAGSPGLFGRVRLPQDQPGPLSERTHCGGAHTAGIHSLLVLEANIGGQGVAKLVLLGLRVWGTICPGSPSLWWCRPSSVPWACGHLTPSLRLSPHDRGCVPTSPSSKDTSQAGSGPP